MLDCIEDGDRCFLTWSFHFRFRSLRQRVDYTTPDATHLVFDASGLITLQQDCWDTVQGLYGKWPVVGPLILETAVDRFLPLDTPYELQLLCAPARSPQW